MKKNDLKKQSSLLIGCLSCILVLMLLCYFGINGSKGTYSADASYTCANSKYEVVSGTEVCCPSGYSYDSNSNKCYDGNSCALYEGQILALYNQDNPGNISFDFTNALNSGTDDLKSAASAAGLTCTKCVSNYPLSWYCYCDGCNSIVDAINAVYSDGGSDTNSCEYSTSGASADLDSLKVYYTVTSGDPATCCSNISWNNSGSKNCYLDITSSDISYTYSSGGGVACASGFSLFGGVCTQCKTGYTLDSTRGCIPEGSSTTNEVCYHCTNSSGFTTSFVWSLASPGTNCSIYSSTITEDECAGKCFYYYEEQRYQWVLKSSTTIQEQNGLVVAEEITGKTGEQCVACTTSTCPLSETSTCSTYTIDDKGSYSVVNFTNSDDQETCCDAFYDEYSWVNNKCMKCNTGYTMSGGTCVANSGYNPGTDTETNPGDSGDITTPTTVERYTVIYDLDGGAFPNGQTSRKEIIISTEILNKPATNPIKDGYKFIGWYKGNSEFTGFGKTINSDITLVAHYEEFDDEGCEYTCDGDDVYDPSINKCVAIDVGNGKSVGIIENPKVTELSCINGVYVRGDLISGNEDYVCSTGYKKEGWVVSDTCRGGEACTTSASNCTKTYNGLCYMTYAAEANCDVDENPKTGSVAIFVVWVIALGTIVYSFWYFKKVRYE